METWPSIFPNPTAEFSGETTNPTIRTQMESGRYRQRNRFTRENRIYNANWEMSDAEFGSFQSWFIYKISNGADFFTVSMATGGEGLKPVTARFVGGRYGYSNTGVLTWNVTASLEVQEASVWDETTLDAMLVIGSIEELEAAVAHLEEFVNN